jgi:hypothetical protein
LDTVSKIGATKVKLSSKNMRERRNERERPKEIKERVD